ncbi:MAG: molybdopterin containing oxidoreductase, partial [Gammaproteobacteria bacterium]
MASTGAIVGAAVPYHSNLPPGLIHTAFADSLKAFANAGKDSLTGLSDRPLNIETPAHLLNDDVTPNPRHVVCNDGIAPKLNAMEPDTS